MSKPTPYSPNTYSSPHKSLLQQKLSKLDTHMLHSQYPSGTLLTHPHLLTDQDPSAQLPRQPPSLNTLKLRSPISYLFKQGNTLKLHFPYSPIPDNLRYVLKVEPSHLKVEVHVQVDDAKKMVYLVDRPRGIFIQPPSGWKTAIFVVVAIVKERFAAVRIQLDTIVVQHQVKIKCIPSQRRNVQREMHEYLQNNLNREKIEQIMQKKRRKSMMSSRSNRGKSVEKSRARAIQLLQTSRIFRTQSGFNESTSITRSTSAVKTEPKIQQTQLKRYFHEFEQSKSRYLSHLQKMSPTRSKQIQKNQQIYNHNKSATLHQVCSTILTITFLQRMLHTSIVLSKHRIRKIHIIMLCKKFAKNLIHATRMRISIQNRNRMAPALNICAISCVLWSNAKDKAYKTIINRVKVDMFMHDAEQAMKMAEEFLKMVVLVQRKWRADTQKYRIKFVRISEIQGVEYRNQEHCQATFKKYRSYCHEKSKKLKFGFMKYRNLIQKLANFNH